MRFLRVTKKISLEATKSKCDRRSNKSRQTSSKRDELVELAAFVVWLMVCDLFPKRVASGKEEHIARASQEEEKYPNEIHRIRLR